MRIRVWGVVTLLAVVGAACGDDVVGQSGPPLGIPTGPAMPDGEQDVTSTDDPASVPGTPQDPAPEGDADVPPPPVEDGMDGELDGQDPGTVPPTEMPAPGSYRAGEFLVLWNGDTDSTHVRVVHEDEPEHTLFETTEGEDFVVAAVARERVEAEFASFEVSDDVQETCGAVAVDEIESLDDNAVVVRGTLGECGLGFELSFENVEARQLRFVVRFNDPRFNRVFLNYRSSADERFWGFGQQYSRLNLKGELLPIWVQEQGHGRGLEPLSTALSTLAGGAAGEWFTTYTAVPFYLSNKRRALMLENTEYSEFDMRESNRTTVRVFSGEMTGRIFYGAQPLDLLEAHTAYTGRMSPLPEWTQTGAIVRAYAGEDSVLDLVDRLEAAEVPLTGLWVEDWMGRRQNLTGTRLWWNWQYDRTIYPDWEGFVGGLRDRGIRVMTYFNPYLTDARENRNHERYLYLEAEAADYLVRDSSGRVFTFGAGGFDGAIVDLTNTEARNWLKKIMVDHLRTGVAGWMADFGEALPYDAQLASGEDAESYHNRWPVEWARLNREVLQEAGVEGEGLFWTRSGGAKTPAHTTMAWLGDQTVTWDRFDGMKTVVNALVAASLSGYTIIHGDIGGYLSVNYPFVTLRRTKELLLRWIELGAFQGLFRTHDSINPEQNPQVYSDEESLSHFARFAKLYTALAPYREQLMEEAAQSGHPMIRHPYLHFPEDRVLQEYEFQFMLGADFMVAPVLDPDVDTMEVYLPSGRWTHVWSGETFGSETSGGTHAVAAPIGQPPFFFREDSAAGEQLLQRMDALQLR